VAIISRTAEEHYNNAIKYSIYLGGSAKAQTYLSQPKVAYDSCRWLEAENWFSKWIALYNRPFETWTEMRRLITQLPLAENAISGLTD
jgi:hypothetical protein